MLKRCQRFFWPTKMERRQIRNKEWNNNTKY